MLYTISNVEIFRVGEWNKTKFTDKDLDSIVESFGKDKAGFEPPIKLGHDKKQKLLQQDGYPAAGWIASLKRIGDKLLADFKDVPKKIKQLIDNKAYKTVSSEIYKNYVNKDDKKFPWVLKAVSLLGADIPAVEGLADITALYDQEERLYYVFNFEGEPSENLNYGKEGNNMPKEDELTKELEKKNKLIAELEKKLAALQKGTTDNDKKLSKDIETLSKTLDDTKAELKKETEARVTIELARKKEKIDTMLTKFVIDKKMVPAQSPILKEILLKSNGEIFVFSKDGKEEKLSVMEGIERFMALQTEIFTTELTRQGQNANDNDETKILAYCKEHGLDPTKDEDYNRAYINAL